MDVKLRARLHFKHTVLNVRGHSGLQLLSSAA